MPRIEFDFADLGREEDQVLPIPSLNVGSESLTATLCPTKAFSEYLVETILAFVEALGQNVVMLHSDQETVLVQLLKAVQRRRVKRTLVRHGPRARRVLGNAYTSQVLPFGERVMNKYTSVPTGNLDQRWGHGIWVGKARMTDEHIILTENGVQKARSLHRVPPEERFVISELKKVRGLPWNGRAEKLKATIVTQQDQGPSGHRRVYLTTRVVARLVQRLAAVAVSVWDHTQKHVECDWKRHCPMRGQIVLERQLDQSLSLLPSPMNQHRRHSRSQRLHHPVLLRRCQRKTFRTSRWIHQWSWDHKNAENAKERGQARRQQVKSLEDQW